MVVKGADGQVTLGDIVVTRHGAVGGWIVKHDDRDVHKDGILIHLLHKQYQIYESDVGILLSTQREIVFHIPCPCRACEAAVMCTTTGHLGLLDFDVKVLGTPLCNPDFVRAHLCSSTEAQRVLLQRIPSTPDLQGAWLLLLFCAGSRANYLQGGATRKGV